MASSRTQSTLERLRSLAKRSKNKRRYVSEFNHSEYKSWTVVDMGKLAKKETLIPNSVNSNVVWCEENCQDEFVLYRRCIYFKNQDDAAYFLVIWQ